MAQDRFLGIDRSLGQQGPDKPVPYLKMNNITSDGRLDLSQLTRVDATVEEIERYHLCVGDFLFNTRNSFELVGKTAVWYRNDLSVVFNNNILRMRFRQGVITEYVNQVFLWSGVKAQLKASKKQTTNVCAVYWKNLKNVKIPLPSPSEQSRVVAHLNNLYTNVYTLKRLQEETSAELEGMLPSILDKTFKGEL